MINENLSGIATSKSILNSPFMGFKKGLAFKIHIPDFKIKNVII
jgi:hypothetical protein